MQIVTCANFKIAIVLRSAWLQEPLLILLAFATEVVNKEASLDAGSSAELVFVKYALATEQVAAN